MNKTNVTFTDLKFKWPEMKTKLPHKKNMVPKELKAEWISNVYEYSSISRDKFNKIQSTSELIDYLYPFCQHFEKYEAFFKFSIMFFVLDDHHEEFIGSDETTAAETILQQLDTAIDKILSGDYNVDVKWKPYILYIFVYLVEICKHYSQQQTRRIVLAIKDYIEGTLMEVKLKRSGHKLRSIDEVLKLRIKATSSLLAYQLIEYSSGISLTDEEYADPLIQKMINSAAKSAVIVNDIFSFKKEYIAAKGQLDQMFNVVATTVISEDITIEEAIKRCFTIVADLEEKILEISRICESDPDCSSSKKTYVIGIKYLNGGNFTASSYISRYHF